MKKNNYHLGIDLLKIFVIYMILAIHMLDRKSIQVSILETVDSHYLQTWIIQASMYVVVSCYIWISAYIDFCSQFKYSKVSSHFDDFLIFKNEGTKEAVVMRSGV